VFSEVGDCIILTMNNKSGILSHSEAHTKLNPLSQFRPYANNLTIRNLDMPERTTPLT